MTRKEFLMGKSIPARYTGAHELMLSSHNGPYLNGDGLPLRDFRLLPGAVIMMNEDEVIGHTVLLDPRREKDPEYLGSGRVVRKEDEGKSLVELIITGYQFHEGRPDFEPVEPAKALVAPQKKKEGNE
jgi:hypothetical protein